MGGLGTLGILLCHFTTESEGALSSSKAHLFPSLGDLVAGDQLCLCTEGAKVQIGSVLKRNRTLDSWFPWREAGPHGAGVDEPGT